MNRELVRQARRHPVYAWRTYRMWRKVRPVYMCEICGALFNNKRVWQWHMWKRHGRG